MIVDEVPKPVKDLVHEYLNLQINSCTVRAPYYRNVKRIRAELRSLVGKGLPSEIVEETLIYSKLRGFILEGKSEEEIRDFMILQGIGVDCSGFAAHIYDKWLKSSDRGNLVNKLQFKETSFYRSIIRRIRPIENISANDLTNEKNSTPIKLNQISPGDLIRLKGVKRGDHLAIIYSTTRDESNSLKQVTYVHSSPAYQKDNGVKFGEIVITDPEKDLKDQQWREVDKNGKCWTLECLLRDYEQNRNGLRRPNFLIKPE
ncbi:hypothetical protein H6764_01905 [Candidatus Nomurabacteria bacterium]|nr:hypothetical protein [Candidatus Nomurabacteria bacterium]